MQSKDERETQPTGFSQTLVSPQTAARTQGSRDATRIKGATEFSRPVSEVRKSTTREEVSGEFLRVSAAVWSTVLTSDVCKGGTVALTEQKIRDLKVGGDATLQLHKDHY